MYKAIVTDDRDWDDKNVLVIHFNSADDLQKYVGKIDNAINKTIVEKKKIFYDLDLTQEK